MMPTAQVAMRSKARMRSNTVGPRAMRTKASTMPRARRKMPALSRRSFIG